MQLGTPVTKVKEEAEEALSSHSTEVELEAGQCIMAFDLDDCSDELVLKHLTSEELVPKYRTS